MKRTAPLTSSIRGLGDAYAFRRLLWLVIGTVVVPTLLLSAYGVYAVRNQRIALRRAMEAQQAVSALGLSSWLYAAGLVVLVATVLVGVVITLRSTARELRLSRLQTDFVSNVSHELRTPLTSIRMFVETLQSGRLKDPERVAEALDLLGQETDRLTRRIERVLNWARMEAGRRIYDDEPVAVHDIVNDALSALRSQTMMSLNPGGVAVEVEQSLPTVNADRDALAEAVLNLLQNALRHGRGDQVEVKAFARDGMVGISVRDRGPGIPPRHRKRIFEKFYQVDPLLTSQTHGSGLGLAIVRSIVRGHGGRVDVESEVGVGSTFTIWLPARA